MAQSLFQQESPVAARQAKTDRLILARLLKEKATHPSLNEDDIKRAHAILLKWADLDSKGRLAKLTESQLQGDFLAEVFCDALGYTRLVSNEPRWTLIQHPPFKGQTPDAILGHFQQDRPHKPLAVIELKGPKVHLDRDRSNGRTAVDQCWDYLVNTAPECRWGIVSNMVSFRLYERDSTKRAYEHFALQSLCDLDTFRQFYVLFHRQGLIDKVLGAPPRAVELLQKTQTRQRTIGDELYASYSRRRTNLIAELHFQRGFTLDESIEMAQRLFDRIMFIAFCEDRQLLPEDTIPKAYKVAGFHAVTNPRWQNFKNLFRFIDEGAEQYGIPGYNGGLFARHPVDDLELPDEPWADFFKTISGYDFADEVNLDVLGHLFERSITELEKLKETGLFGGDAAKTREFATMPQSALRKQLGIYYTPPELTSRIVDYTVDELIAERFGALAVRMGVPHDEAERGVIPEGADEADYWRACLDILKRLKIVDPACGSGAFLFQAYNALEHRYHEVLGHLERAGDASAPEFAERVPHVILGENLYGVDLSPEAVEISQLAMWIRSAAPGQTLATLSRNIVHGNSLVHDGAVHPHGFDWRERFPDVFDRPEGGFDCVIGNPPWERIKLQEREFFSLPAPEIATATNAAKRRTLVAKLESQAPELYAKYQEAQAEAEALLTYCRKSKQYPLTGKGDINLYAVFAELASRIVAPRGRVGLLTPSGIASDKTTKDFFASIAESDRLIRLYDFENKKVFFPDVHASFKFCILNFGGAAVGGTGVSPVKNRKADFAFFLHRVEELEDPNRHIPLSGDDIRLLNPNTRTCPIFRTRRDAEITKAIYRRVPVLIDRNREGPTGNPWGVSFNRMFDQTNDAELFREAETLKKKGFTLKGNRWVKGKREYLPLYEAKMVQMYDHRAADVLIAEENWVRQGQTRATTPVEHQNPEHSATPRFWVELSDVGDAAPRLCFKDVTSPTNQRTMIAALIPPAAVVNSAPLVYTSQSRLRECCLLANLNSVAYDFVARQKISGVHLNFFIVEQVPTLAPESYRAKPDWDETTTLEQWISERVLKLTCTAEDMLPLAEACDFTGGSFKKEYGGRLNKWDERERAELTAQLDAAYFHLYGVSRDDAEYILSTFKGIHTPGDQHPRSVTTAQRILELYDEYS